MEFFSNFWQNWEKPKSRKLDKFEKYKKTENENGKNQEKNVFDQNFNENQFLTTKFQLSEPRGH